MALKRCRVQHEMTPKHKHRWQLEVDIMRRLNHDNVVIALEVPEELAVGPEELPLLAMEYCSKGDLRRVSENKGTKYIPCRNSFVLLHEVVKKHAYTKQ